MNGGPRWMTEDKEENEARTKLKTETTKSNRSRRMRVESHCLLVAVQEDEETWLTCNKGKVHSKRKENRDVFRNGMIHDW
jgi:hypothetical protein